MKPRKRQPPKTDAQRERHRLAALKVMDCPLVRAKIGRAIALSWRDPAVRAKRVAGLRLARLRRAGRSA